jgi:hypothetical protein
MPLLVRMGANLQCSFGAAPAPLTVVDPTTIIEDAMCSSIANPTVAAATAAALGVLTPMPCVPVPTGPWIPGAPTVTLRNMPALDQTCKCMCAWGGIIQVVVPGAVKTLD